MTLHHLRGLSGISRQKRYFTVTSTSKIQRVYSFGDNFLDASGHLSLDKIDEPSLIGPLAGVDIERLSSGWGYSTFLTRSGSVLTVGRTMDFKNVIRHINIRNAAPGLQRRYAAFSRLLWSSDYEISELPLPAGERALDVRCSAAGNIVLPCLSGATLMNGANPFGQCGRGTQSEVEYAPSAVISRTGTDSSPAELLSVAPALEHTLATTYNGQLNVWGRGDRGQLGLSSQSHYSSPIPLLGPGLEFLEHPFLAVEAAGAVSYALDMWGQLWTWGKQQGLFYRGGRLVDTAEGDWYDLAADSGARKASSGPLEEVSRSEVVQDQFTPRRVVFKGEVVPEDVQGLYRVVGTLPTLDRDAVPDSEPSSGSKLAVSGAGIYSSSASAPSTSSNTSPGLFGLRGSSRNGLRKGITGSSRLVVQPWLQQCVVSKQWVFSSDFLDSLDSSELKQTEDAVRQIAEKAGNMNMNESNESFDLKNALRTEVQSRLKVTQQNRAILRENGEICYDDARLYVRADELPPAQAIEMNNGGKLGEIEKLYPHLISPGEGYLGSVGALGSIVRSPVALLSLAHSSASVLTCSGEIFLLGPRGRGVEFDDSSDSADSANSLDSESRREEDADHHRIPERFRQIMPLKVNCDALGSKKVYKLRSSLHHGYAITTDGAVFRWGWGGVAKEFAPLKGRCVVDLAFGFGFTNVLIKEADESESTVTL